MPVFLCHEDVPCTGQILQAGGGWFALVTWQRANGLFLDIDQPMTIEQIRDGWDTITDLDKSKEPEQYGGQHHDGQMDQIISKLKPKSSL